MKQLLTDYGALIGPTLGFFLGVLTMYAKQIVDANSESKNSRYSYQRFFNDIKYFTFPTKFFYNRSDGILPHADQARNATNLARYRSQLKMYRRWADSIGDDVYKAGTGNEIRAYNQISIMLDNILAEIEEYQKDVFAFNYADYANLKAGHEMMLGRLIGGDALDYYLGSNKSE